MRFRKLISHTQYNTEDRPTPNKFLTISSLPQTAYRASFQKGFSPVSAPGEGPGVAAGAAPGAAGSAFANFGVGGGGVLGGSGWRGKR